tara:strand:- start:9338 stop:10120 length:783 start_codon:yes stop_codon:yes gene_type:complete
MSSLLRATIVTIIMFATSMASVGAQQQGFRVVVIDPGHGGAEVGAVGATGLMEKNVVLDISKRLGQLLEEQLGLEVYLTRDQDIYKEKEDRTALANNVKANVFLSIHANSYRGRGVHGAETFFLSDQATDDDARRLAAIENNAMGLEGPTGSDSNLQMLLWDMAQTTHLRESSVLAEMVQSNMNSLGGTTDRGIKQAPFVVLKGANMPAVLVEVGFLSNPDEERLLADAAYRQQIANMLFQSLNRYRQRHASLIGGGSIH